MVAVLPPQPDQGDRLAHDVGGDGLRGQGQGMTHRGSSSRISNSAIVRLTRMVPAL